MLLVTRTAACGRATLHAFAGRRVSATQRGKLLRLLSSLAVLEQRDGQLNHASLSAITAAQKLGGSVTAFVAGGGVRSVAEQVAKVKALQKVIAVDNRAYDKVRLTD